MDLLSLGCVFSSGIIAVFGNVGILGNDGTLSLLALVVHFRVAARRDSVDWAGKPEVLTLTTTPSRNTRRPFSGRPCPTAKPTSIEQPECRGT